MSTRKSSYTPEMLAIIGSLHLTPLEKKLKILSEYNIYVTHNIIRYYTKKMNPQKRYPKPKQLIHELRYKDPKGNEFTVARFHNVNDAKDVFCDPKWIKDNGVAGRIVTCGIFESKEDFWKEYDVQRTRRTALAKLTPSEKKSLGILV